MAEISTKPYMIRAIYEWCCDSGHTPYLLVKTGGRARVPMQHVHNGEIVLNVSPMATNALHMGNELIQFEARFNGVPEQIVVPVGNVAAIYARETGSGMAFSPEIDEGDGDGGGNEGGEVVDLGGASRAGRAALKAVPPARTGERPDQAGAGADAAGRTDRDQPDGAESGPAGEADRAEAARPPRGGVPGDAPDPAAVRPGPAGAGALSGSGHKGEQAGSSTAPPSTTADAAAVPGQEPAAPVRGEGAPVGGPVPAHPDAAPSRQGSDGDDRPPPAGGGRPRLVRVK